MRFRIDLKIFIFLILFYFTKQIESYAFIMIFAIIIMVLSDRKLTLAQYTAPSGAKLFGGTSLYLLWAIIFAWLILLASNGSSAFIYFQF